MKNLVALQAVLNRIDGDTFSTLEGRITFQKRIYLVQELGLDLGYRFSWNQYGPYSSGLAQDGLLLETGVVSSTPSPEDLQFTQPAERSIERFAELVETPPGTTQAAWLELLTSLHYLASSSHGGRLSDDDSFLSLKTRLLAAKPYLSDHENLIDEARRRLASAIEDRLAAT